MRTQLRYFSESNPVPVAWPVEIRASGIDIDLELGPLVSMVCAEVCQVIRAEIIPDLHRCVYPEEADSLWMPGIRLYGLAKDESTGRELATEFSAVIPLEDLCDLLVSEYGEDEEDEPKISAAVKQLASEIKEAATRFTAAAREADHD